MLAKNTHAPNSHMLKCRASSICWRGAVTGLGCGLLTLWLCLPVHVDAGPAAGRPDPDAGGAAVPEALWATGAEQHRVGPGAAEVRLWVVPCPPPR